MKSNESPAAINVHAAADGRARPPFASDEKRREAIELFKSGVGYMKASRILNLPANTLRDWSVAFKRGRFRATLSPHLYRYTEKTRRKVVRLRMTGATWSEILELTGVSSTTARKWVDDYTKKTGQKEAIELDEEFKH